MTFSQGGVLELGGSSREKRGKKGLAMGVKGDWGLRAVAPESPFSPAGAVGVTPGPDFHRGAPSSSSCPGLQSS